MCASKNDEKKRFCRLCLRNEAMKNQMLDSVNGSLSTTGIEPVRQVKNLLQYQKRSEVAIRHSQHYPCNATKFIPPLVTIFPNDFNIMAILRSFAKITACGPSGLRIQHLLDAAKVPLNTYVLLSEILLTCWPRGKFQCLFPNI